MKLKGEIEFPREVKTIDYENGVAAEKIVLSAKTMLDEDLEISVSLKVDGDALSELERQLKLDKRRRKISIILEPTSQASLEEFGIVKDVETEEKQKKKKQQAKSSKKIDDLSFLPGDKPDEDDTEEIKT
jgi:hypothetical protein